MFPTLIRIGDFQLATYGVLVAAGYLLGILWLERRHERMGMDYDTFWRLIYLMFFGAVAGGKLLYWAVEWRDLVSGALRPIRDLRFGFVFYGGLIGSAAAGRWYQVRKGFSFLRPADYFGVALPMGHAVGRLGCLMAGCCAGAPTGMPWGVSFSRPDALVDPRLAGTPLHPTQLYESLADAAIVLILLRVLKRVEAGRLPHGTVFAGYLLLYAAARFTIEFFRGDDRGGFFLALSVSQWVSIAAVPLAAWILRSNGALKARG